MSSYTDYADLEISLYRCYDNSYAVEMRFSHPDSDADIRLLRSGPVIRFDSGVLQENILNNERYGQLLSESFFADPEVLSAFDKACGNAQTLNVPLRLRLFIWTGASELHLLRWETLRDPRDNTPLLTGEKILFSRYLSSLDCRPVRLLAAADLKALVVIADPLDLSEYNLAKIDVKGELERAEAGLVRTRISALGNGNKASLNNMIAGLREGCDILYLVCHGALVKGEPQLFLEDDSGKVRRTPGSELIARLNELQKIPRLIVLASCQSAGTGNEGAALAALGPRLSEVGIPAVLAMQGNVTMETVAKFMPVFFEELHRDGQIDRAMAVARGAVRERPDWGLPVLFLRLKSGRLWYTPGFAGDQQGMEKWPALINNIRQSRCTPILGPGLSESLLGSRREIARRWAESYHFPMAPHHKDDLPQVAQYLAVNQEYFFPRDKFQEYLRQELLKHYGKALPDELDKAPLEELMKAVGNLRRESDPEDPHRILAELPLPIYITGDYGNLLDTALTAAGKSPRVDMCRWNTEIEDIPSVYDDEPDYQPDNEHPLVYHLFGRIHQQESLVLTEDDYFDYLIGVTGNKELIPGAVRRNLVDTALLFVGFKLDDWDFRVLFRSIMSREGGRRRRKYAHVGVQVDPEQGSILNPERARQYLEKYFEEASVSIFWGSAEDFIRELKKRWDGSKVRNEK